MTKNRKLANAIRDWLLNHNMWIDTVIYFDGVCYAPWDKGMKHFYYNDPTHLIEYEADPARCFDYVNPDGVNMSFEGAVCHMLYYGTEPRLEKSFHNLLEKHGVRLVFGDCWNGSLWPIER